MNWLLISTPKNLFKKGYALLLLMKPIFLILLGKRTALAKPITALLFAGLLFTSGAFAQSFSINTTGAPGDNSSLLDVSSTDKGVLIPRMTKVQKNTIAAPATGLLVYQNGPDSIGFHYYNGTQWVWLSNAVANTGWLITGNGGLDTAINFLGTIDTKPIMLRYNNNWMGMLNPGKRAHFIGQGAGLNNNSALSYNTGIGDSAMVFNTTGTTNTAIGYFSQKGISGQTTGGANTSVGATSLSSITTGSQNIAVGHNSLYSMQSGGLNVILGAGAMEGATKGNGNIGMGLWVLRLNDSSSNNIALGTSALYTNKRDNNVAIGYQSGYYNSYLQSNIDWGTQNTYIGYRSGFYANVGNKNVAIGYHALLGQGFFNSDQPTTDFYKRNVAIGDSALTFAYGSDNVAIGYKALTKSTFTSQHVAIGSRALSNTTSSYPNTAVGYLSQDSTTTGGANTSLGSYSLTNNKLGYNNTAIGNAAMYEATGNSLIDNTAVGNDALRLARYYGHTAMGAGALRNDTSGVYNTAVGYLSMYNNLSGSVNTALGTSALRYNVTSSGNTALGTNNMFNHKTGDFNTAVGYESMFFDTSGNYNTAMGWRSLRYAKNPVQNTALGVGAIEFSDSAYYNTAVGRGAMINRGGIGNTALGFYSSSQGGVTGYYTNYTTTVGYQSGYRNFGNENTFIGYRSGYGASPDSLSGIENVGLGAYTIFFNSTGKSNTALGMGALYGNQTGNGNIGVGTRALGNGGTFSYNVAIGDSAMYGNNANENMAIGTFSMRSNNTGTQNTAIGNYTYRNALNGNQNTLLGHNAGASLQNGSNNTLLGYETNISSSTGINRTVIGSNAYSASDNSLILGSINGTNGATADTRVGIGTTNPNAGSLFSVANNFMVQSTGTNQFSNTVPVMQYMFESGAGNTDRMVTAHSPAFPTWGLQYQDATDRFNFLSGGFAVLTADLGVARVGVLTSTPAAGLDVNGTFQMGTVGTTLSAMIKGSSSINLPSIAAGASLIQTIPIANVALNATVHVSPSIALIDGLVIAYARVSSAGNVEIKFTNTTGLAIDQAATTYNITVIQ